MSAAAMSGRPLQYFIHDDPDALRMEISGSLIGAAAKDAYEAWRRASFIARQGRAVVDLSYVTEADEKGRAALRAWREQGAQILVSCLPTAGNPSSADDAPTASAEAKQENAEIAGVPVFRQWNARCVSHAERSKGSSESKYKGERKCFRGAC